ncbi:MAG TPA: alpha-L-arabinofuranosidase C-terminal domain-containing protein [Streptosporangiaceae bacterium]|nr:alpha-L-arabinofuranosidase C-terminal domain-containing protein [Streptosporangiaceae bacterium]
MISMIQKSQLERRPADPGGSGLSAISQPACPRGRRPGERGITCADALIKRASYRLKIGDPPKIAYDERNVWYRNMTVDLAERYTFPDALAVGTYLNIFIRNSDTVKMANLARLVNAIAPIVTTSDTATVRPIYYPALLHAPEDPKDGAVVLSLPPSRSPSSKRCPAADSTCQRRRCETVPTA